MRPILLMLLLCLSLALAACEKAKPTEQAQSNSAKADAAQPQQETPQAQAVSTTQQPSSQPPAPVAALSAEQFTHDLGGSFRSVRDTLMHIIGGEWIWLAYWKETSHSSAFLKDLIKRRDALFNPVAFPNVAAVQLKWAEVEKEQVEFMNRVTNESLETMLPFRTTQVRLVHLMQHLANHSTYHRGQVALMMRQLDSVPLPTDFHVFLGEGRNEAVPAH